MRGREGNVAEIVILNGVRAGAVFALPDIPTILGRSPEAHIQVEDPWISSMHAMFERRGGEVWVIDLESRNGTFVGDERVAEARLAPGMRVRFGRTEVRVDVGTQAADDGEPPTLDAPPRPARSRNDPKRATIRSDTTAGTGVPRVAPEDEDTDPVSLARRPATVLRLALHLRAGDEPDAQAVRAALDAATRAVRNHGGVPARMAGGGLLAVFGLSGTAPDDAARAMAAAREARSGIRALDAGIDTRLAVDRGAVVTGNLGPADAFELAALGEIADRTERLLAVAAPGQLLAGPGVGPAARLGAPVLVRVGSEELAVYRDRDA